MPVYEYVCEKCGEQFEALRPMADSDAPIRCPACKSKRTSRTISVFAAHSGGKVVAGGNGGGCGGCSGGSCSTCGG
jgi:putative FmdB family regulatory protein